MILVLSYTIWILLGLPEGLQVLGNQYVRDEFRRHKTCTTHEASLFMNEWTVSVFWNKLTLYHFKTFFYLFKDYAISLANQLGIKGKPNPIEYVGNNLDVHKLGDFRDEQVAQLYELLQASKGMNEENR